MKRFRALWMWFLLLSKRLYKKPTFLVILILIPVLVIGYRLAAKEDSGMQTVVLAQENLEDPVSSEIIEELIGGSQLIHFIQSQTPEQAEQLVKTGKADCAWIFPADTRNAIEDYLKSPSRNEGFVQVVVREQTVPIMLCLEKLSGVMFKHCARYEYLQYMQENEPGMDALSEADILEHYDGANISNQLFSFSYLDSDMQTGEQTNYLLSPIRGLLGVLITLSGLATAMYFLQDQKFGLFSWVPERKHFLVELGYQVVSLLNVSVAAVATMAIAGLNQRADREILVMLLFIFCCASFCQLIRSVFGSIRLIGIFLPLLAVLMIAICPVILDLAEFRYFQFLFPPTYFVNGLYNKKYIFYMLAFTGICWGISYGVRKLFKKV